MVILIFGATGSAGGGVLSACLDDPDVSEVRAIRPPRGSVSKSANARVGDGTGHRTGSEPHFQRTLVIARVPTAFDVMPARPRESMTVTRGRPEGTLPIQPLAGAGRTGDAPTSSALMCSR